MKLTPHPLLADLHGTMDRIVFKRYGDKTVVSKYPDMSKVRRTPAQKAQHQRMRHANRYYRLVVANPALKSHYEQQALTGKTTIHRLVTKEYMHRSKELGRTDIVSELLAAPPPPAR